MAGCAGAQGHTQAGQAAAEVPAASAAVGAGSGEAAQGLTKAGAGGPPAPAPVVDVGAAAALQGAVYSSTAPAAAPAAARSVAASARQHSAPAARPAMAAAAALPLAAEGVPGTPALGSSSVQPAPLQRPGAAALVVSSRQAGGEREAAEGSKRSCPPADQQPATPTATPKHSQAAEESDSSGCAESGSMLSVPRIAELATLPAGVVCAQAVEEPRGGGCAELMGAPAAACSAQAAAVQVPGADPIADPTLPASAAGSAGVAIVCQEATAMKPSFSPLPHAAGAACVGLAATGCQADALGPALCGIGTQYSEQEEAAAPETRAHADPTPALAHSGPARYTDLVPAAGAAPGDKAPDVREPAQGANNSLEGPRGSRSLAGGPAGAAAAPSAFAAWSGDPTEDADGPTHAAQKAVGPKLASAACAAAVDATSARAAGRLGSCLQPAGEQGPSSPVGPAAWTPSRSSSLPSSTHAGMRSGIGFVGCGAPGRKEADAPMGAPGGWPQTLGEHPNPGRPAVPFGIWRPCSAGAGSGAGLTWAGPPLRRLSSAPAGGGAWSEARGGAWASPGPRARWPALPQVPPTARVLEVCKSCSWHASWWPEHVHMPLNGTLQCMLSYL